MSIKFIGSIVSFNSEVSLLGLHLDGLTTGESGLLKSPTFNVLDN
jgi:hypothetical protein